MILVTGAAGAIGQRLVRKLVAVYGDNNIITVTREPFDIPGALNRVHDLTEPMDESILDIGYSVNGIIHLAAVHHVSDSIKRPEYYYQQNTAMTNNILGYAVRRRVKWFQFASTGMVYDQPQQNQKPFFESDPLEPRNPYALSKLLCENLVTNICKYHGIFYGISRIFNVVVPVEENDTMRSRFLIPAICRAAKQGQTFDVFVNPVNNQETIVRDYVHVNDVVDAMYLLADYLDKNIELYTPKNSDNYRLFDIEPCVINICTGKGTSVFEIINWTQKVSDKKIAITISEPQHWEPYFVGNPGAARTLLDFKPRFNIIDMIEQQWRLINEQQR